MPWFGYIALRHLFPKGKRFPFFTFMSITGVALGVAVLIVVISVFNGFGHEIRSRIAETYGDLRVEKRGDFIYDYESVLETLRSDENVLQASPYAHGVVMLQWLNRPVFPAIQGIELDSEIDVVPIEEKLVLGSLDDFDDDSIFISSGISDLLGIYPGHEVEIYTPLLLERLKMDQIILPRVVRIAGVFHTGWESIDENTIISTLRTMQELYGLGEGVHGIKIRLNESRDTVEESMRLQTVLESGFSVFSWMDSQQEFLAVLEFEKRMMFFLLFIIIIVSAFSIMSSLLISVIRKTREIGLLGAMGASDKLIAACFCLQGLFIGISGTVVGFGLGFTLLGFRNEITQGISSLMGLGDSMAQFYMFSYLPVHIEVSDLVLIALLSVLVATLAGLIPAYKASKLKPVEALRSE